MNALYAQIQNEQALSEAIVAQRAFTVVGFEPSGELIAFITGPFGSYWATL